MTTRKPYGSLPKQVHKHLPRLVDLLRETEAVPRPYEFVAEVFGVSPSRVQQVVLAEKRKGKEAETHAVAEQTNQLRSWYSAT